MSRAIRLATVITMIAALTVTAPVSAQAAGQAIVVDTTVQAAVDAASPGDTVVVPAGTYREAVNVTKSGITIAASVSAVLDGTGLGASFGIRVGSTDGSRLEDFSLHGFEIRGYAISGVRLNGVDGFRLTGGRYVDNPLYGIFPVRTTDGRVDHNFVSGSQDSGIYIGRSTDIADRPQLVHDNTVGIEVELASRITRRRQRRDANSIGALVFVRPLFPVKVTEDVLVTGNVFSGNRRANPFVEPDDPLRRCPGASGSSMSAPTECRSSATRSAGNATAGVGVVSLPPGAAAADPAVDPEPDDGVVSGNITRGNGSTPDPRLPCPAPAGRHRLGRQRLDVLRRPPHREDIPAPVAPVRMTPRVQNSGELR